MRCVEAFIEGQSAWKYGVIGFLTRGDLRDALYIRRLAGRPLHLQICVRLRGRPLHLQI